MAVAIDALITDLAAVNHGAITMRQLTDEGVSRGAVHRRIGGLLHPVARGVYIIGSINWQSRLAAALLATPGSAGSHLTAARLESVPVEPNERVPIELSCPKSRRRALEGVRVYFTVDLGPDDRTTVDGFEVTTVARTLCDLAWRLNETRLQHVAEGQIVAGACTVGELCAQIAGFVRRGRKGSTKLRALAEHLDVGRPLAASDLERRLERILRAAGTPELTGQFRPPWYDGRRGIVDFASPTLRLVFEADGRPWHAVTQAQTDDRARDRRALSHGWVVARYSGHEIRERAASLEGEVRRLITSRRTELGV